MEQKNFIETLLNEPVKLVGAVIAFVLVAFVVLVKLSPSNCNTNGSLAELSLEDSLLLQGQQVYRESGCQYCHSQNLRPVNWEVKRFSDVSKFGYFPVMTEVETYYNSPSLMGSTRIGPDLTHVASKYDADSLKTLLTSKTSDSAAASFHPYSGLFGQTFNPVVLSWRTKALMFGGMSFSDAFLKSSFQAAREHSKGEALVAYLLTLGKKQMQFQGQFYQN